MPSASSRYRLIPILLTQAVGLACGIASVRLNSHLIPPATLGFYGLFLTLTPLGLGVVCAGLLKFVTRNWAAAADRRAIARGVLHRWVRRLPWLALLCGVATVALLRTSESALPVTWFFLFVAAALVALGALGQFALQASRAHWRDFGVTASGAVLRSFGPPLLYTLLPVASSLLLGFTLHAVVLALGGLWAAHSLLGGKFTEPTTPLTIGSAYEGPLFIALAVAGWVVGAMNRWVVAGFFGEQEAGYFTLIGGIAVIVTSMVGTVLMQYLQPGLFALGDGPRHLRVTLARRVDLAALVYNFVAGLGLAAVHFALPWLVGPLISPVYREALPWLIPAGCFGIATMTAIFFHIMLLAGRRESACGPVDLTTALLLATGCVVSAAAGRDWFVRWLIAAPLLPWLFTRTFARYYFFKPDAAPAPSPAP